MQSENLTWHDAAELTVEGKGWPETARSYDRLPARAEGIVPPEVWNLSRHSAGLAVRFVTDAEALEARWTLRSEEKTMDHMAATGASGLDLYVRDGGRWRWLAVGRPMGPSTEQHSQLLTEMLPGLHEMMLYLPLYNGVESLELGVAAGRTLDPAPPRRHKPVVFYGTSIVQGGCASRTGMAYASILGRWLDRPTVNLGFSGSGRAEPEVARLLAELDPSAYVLDAVPNLEPDEVAERMERFVGILRQARPATDIVLVEGIRYQQQDFVASRRRRMERSRAALSAARERLSAAGVAGLHYVAGDSLLGDDDEATVDGTHPTDVGFLRLGRALEPVLRPLV